MTEEQWQKVRALNGNRRPRLKVNRVRLVPYGTSQGLTVLGRSKCILEAGAGAKITTMVYVVRGAKESLPGMSILRFYSDGGGKDIGTGEEYWGLLGVLGLF